MNREWRIPKPEVARGSCLFIHDSRFKIDDPCVVPSSDMAELSIADVERVAALAQIELTDAEKQLFTRQLADILHYAEQIQALDTTGVPATAHVNAAQHEREDELELSLPVDDALAAAPDGAPDAGLFRVPKVIGG